KPACAGFFRMRLCNLLPCLQQNLPINIEFFGNGKLGLGEFEQKTKGKLPTFTDLKNPDFGQLAQVCGLWGARVDRADQLEGSVANWLAADGPALLHIDVEPMELVMPPFVEVKSAAGMALYAAKAVLHGKAGDVLEMIEENI